MNNEIVAKQYLKHLEANCKEQRGEKFYTNKLCLTPKYLSKLVKESCVQSANDWKTSYIVLEVKALLKSTNKTIQQISDELNFPYQLFFEKYFKRHVVMQLGVVSVFIEKDRTIRLHPLTNLIKLLNHNILQLVYW